MEPEKKTTLTPTAKALKGELDRILVAAKARPKELGFIDNALQNTLKTLTAADMIAMEPPGADVGIWTNDLAFCKRLGARLFGVSPESVDELSWQHLIYFQQIVTANFIRSLGDAAP